MLGKKELRKRMLDMRSGIKGPLRARKSEQIVKAFLQSASYQKASYLFSYIPFGDEPDIRMILSTALQDGKKVAVPKTFTDRKVMIPYLFTGWEDLVPGVYGILEPDPERTEMADPEKIDLIVMPGVAFDRQGGRLGYGGGYYDRFLAGLPKRPLMMAPCFSEQVLDEVPMEKHDFRVDGLVTDQVLITCTNSF